jgi:hypothetical protein
MGNTNSLMSMENMGGMSGMGHSVPTWDTVGAILMLGWAVAMWGAVGALALANRGRAKPWVFNGAAAVIGIGIVGQIGHLQEHIAQAGYWIQHPNAKAWMTPWGNGLARGYGQVDDSKPSLGMEILHLVGNFIFLAGIAGVVLITARARRTTARKWGKMGVWMQGIHGLEHVALTLSVALGAKKAIGLSTWFGQLDAGAGATTYRIWWHTIANLIGSYIFAMAVYHLWKERATVRASFEVPAKVEPETVPVREPALVHMNRPVPGQASAV